MASQQRLAFFRLPATVGSHRGFDSCGDGWLFPRGGLADPDYQATNVRINASEYRVDRSKSRKLC